VGSADAVGVVDGVGAGDTVVVGVGVGPEPVAELLHALTSSTAAIAMINRR
jgi:fructose-1-phosphate kinase PfkB-like protein